MHIIGFELERLTGKVDIRPCLYAKDLTARLLHMC